MARRINAAGLSLIKQWEGLKTTAYKKASRQRHIRMSQAF
ncbi:lysozyme domain protein [Brucella grignonensis]|uniref:Lysozyme domain protein n=1 Tax=Brucella grignonensis TaxID=94627 RepID=A0A256FC58_9HYPH|nr:lysozyme domain protein [Brucella grignonensis]